MPETKPPAELEFWQIPDFDLHLFTEGTHQRIWEILGAHPLEHAGTQGVRFAVWAPNAASVSVVGDFNAWEEGASPLVPRVGTGVWEGFLPGIEVGAKYKYAIQSRNGEYKVKKADPVGFHFEKRPDTATRVFDLAGYQWSDQDWMKGRKKRQGKDAPLSIYEVHLGSWMRVPEEEGRWLTYREMAPKLAGYCKEMGFTHVELLPINEHPFDGSWGYQCVGYYAPTSRFGDPHDFMHLVDTLHQHGIGVLLDWVPAHFPRDEHGLGYFDGTHLYEHADPRQGLHQDWDTFIFNFGRTEVKNFLIANALYWLELYHLDGLRVDAVASMLYLDYSRKPGEWVPNKFGGRENLEAIDFLKEFNQAVTELHPDCLTIAEESTSWPMVSRPTYLGGLGFTMKWNMGWMHDTLDYTSKDPIHRHFHHQQMTFGLMYAFSENFVLPYSHDEVVHGKGSMLGKMPGDPWKAFATLRCLYGWQWTQPGKKLLFMGQEFGQVREWNHDISLDWHLLDQPFHGGLQRWVADLNTLLQRRPALHEIDFDSKGFEWIDCHDSVNSVFSFLRWDKSRRKPVLMVFNFTPIARKEYVVGVPSDGIWVEVVNSDAEVYGGSGVGNDGKVVAVPEPAHTHEHSISLTLPPLGLLVLEPAQPLAIKPSELGEKGEASKKEASASKKGETAAAKSASQGPEGSRSASEAKTSDEGETSDEGTPLAKVKAKSGEGALEAKDLPPEKVDLSGPKSGLEASKDAGSKPKALPEKDSKEAPKKD